MANQQKSSLGTIWLWILIGGIVGFIKVGGAFWLWFSGFAGIMMVVGFFDKLFDKTKAKNTNNSTAKSMAYTFDFDALSPTYQSQLLKQQFGYFFKYRNISDSGFEFYCAEDELDGYRFSFWVEYLIENTYSSKAVKVKQGTPICTVYISSNKGATHRYESSSISAPIDGVVTGLLKGLLQKDSVLFRIKKEKEVEYEEAEIVASVEVNETQEIPQVQTISFEDALKDLEVKNEEIKVEKLDDVLKWEMPDIDDIEVPENEESNSGYDASVAYHATITNLSDFDWYNFKAICYSSVDETQKEAKLIGNVKIGTKCLLSSRYDMFYLEGENAQGEQKRFRPFALDKDSDITATTIFIERS